MKSANSISTTGRMPLRAIPIAIPTMPPSFSGVSITRSAPNRAINPSVARKTPPSLPTSSPRTITLGSRAISSRSASRIAWSRVTCAIPSPPAGQEGVALLRQVPRRLRVHVLEEAFPGHGRGLLLGLHRLPHRLPGRLRLLRLRAVGQKAPAFQERAEAEDRILPPPGRHLLLRPVHLRIVGGRVGAHPVRDRLDQGRSPAGTRPGKRLADHLVHGEHVVAVHPDSGEAVPVGLDGEGRGGGLPRDGDG